MMNLIPIPCTERAVCSATLGVVSGAPVQALTGQAAGVMSVVAVQPDFTSLFAELLGAMTDSGQGCSETTAVAESFVPGLSAFGEPESKSTDADTEQAVSATPVQNTSPYPTTVVIPVRAQTESVETPVVAIPAAVSQTPAWTPVEAQEVPVQVAPDEVAPASQQPLQEAPQSDIPVAHRVAADYTAAPVATAKADQPNINARITAARSIAVPALDTDAPVQALTQTQEPSDEEAVRPRQTPLTSAAFRQTGQTSQGEALAQPAKADFSWMLTDPARQVRQLTVSESVPVQATLEAVEAIDKPAQDVAPAEVALLQADTVITAKTRTDAASPAEADRESPEVHQRVIDQIVKEVRLVKLQDGSDLMVRLQPPELGSLRIHLVSDAQGVTSQIEASNPQVKSLLQAHMPILMDALSSAGVRMDSVSVTAAMGLSAWADSTAHQHSQQQTGTPRSRQGVGGVDPVVLNGEQPTAYGLQESAAYSWLA